MFNKSTLRGKIQTYLVLIDLLNPLLSVIYWNTFQQSNQVDWFYEWFMKDWNDVPFDVYFLMLTIISCYIEYEHFQWDPIDFWIRALLVFNAGIFLCLSKSFHTSSSPPPTCLSLVLTNIIFNQQNYKYLICVWVTNLKSFNFVLLRVKCNRLFLSSKSLVYLW